MKRLAIALILILLTCPLLTAAAEVRSAQEVKPWIFCGTSTPREAARNPPAW